MVKFNPKITTFALNKIHYAVIKKRDVVQFLPDYKEGDVEFNYILIEDPDSGKVTVIRKYPA